MKTPFKPGGKTAESNKSHHHGEGLERIRRREFLRDAHLDLSSAIDSIQAALTIIQREIYSSPSNLLRHE